MFPSWPIPLFRFGQRYGRPVSLYQDLLLCPPEEAPKLYQTAYSMGMPDYMCDVFTLPAAAVKLGELPPPIVATTGIGGACRVWIYHLKAFAEHFGVPTFNIDTPQYYNEESVKYLAGQLGELIQFVEKHVPGLKYDEDKHREIIEANRMWVNYYRKEWELKSTFLFPRQQRQYPLSAFILIPRFMEKQASNEFWRQRTEEIEITVSKGVQKEEKIRILWLDPLPLYIDVFAIFERLGVSLTAVWLPALSPFNGRRANWGTRSLEEAHSARRRGTGSCSQIVIVVKSGRMRSCGCVKSLIVTLLFTISSLDVTTLAAWLDLLPT